VKTVLRNESYIGVMHDFKRKNFYVEDDEGRRVRYEHRPRNEWIPVAIPAIVDQQLWTALPSAASRIKKRRRATGSTRIS
jgi:site-specific DNA recombinase